MVVMVPTGVPTYWLFPVSYTHLDVYKRQIGQLFGLIAERLFTEDDFDENGMLKEGSPAQKFSDMSNLRPGDIKYKDLNGDGEVTAVDKLSLIHIYSKMVKLGIPNI